MAVAGDLAALVVRGDDVGDGRFAGHGALDVADCSAELAVLDGEGLALQQDHLAGGLAEPGVLDDLRRGAGLAVEAVGVRRLLGAGQVAGDQGDDDEREPSEDGGLLVPRAPAPGTGGDAAWASTHLVRSRVRSWGGGEHALDRARGRWPWYQGSRHAPPPDGRVGLPPRRRAAHRLASPATRPAVLSRACRRARRGAWAWPPRSGRGRRRSGRR